VIELEEEQHERNAFDLMRVNSEFVLNEIDDSESQFEKQMNQ
jgi:hypothetical protein